MPTLEDLLADLRDDDTVRHYNHVAARYSIEDLMAFSQECCSLSEFGTDRYSVLMHYLDQTIARRQEDR